MERWLVALDASVAQKAAASSAAAALQKHVAAAAKQLQDKQAAAASRLQAEANSKVKPGDCQENTASGGC